MNSRAGQAADWFLRLQEEGSEEQLREWVQWCAADAENLREFERVRDTWQGMAPLAGAADSLLPRASRHVWLSAAAAALVAIVAAWWWFHIPQTALVAARQTTNESATLPDGSTITLAPRTNVAVDFSGGTRSLNLSRGEAYFKVSPDKRKPFVVRAAGLKVTAIGTAFNIRSEPKRVVVTVQEGVVEAASGAERWRVTAGNQIAYDLGRKSARVAAVNPARELAWREGRLEYFMEPLETVVADANRYSNRRIEIADPRVAKLTYTGTIFTQSIDDWLQAVASTFPVRVETRDDSVALFSR